MKKRSKRYKEIIKTAVKDKKIAAKEILDLVKNNSTTKFDESIDISLRINLKQSKGGDLSLRTTVNLPNGSGKKSKVAVLCEPDKIEEAKKSGAEVFGSEDLLEKIAAGKFDFKIKSPPASYFIKEAAKLKSGSKEPGRVVAGSITMKQAETIAKEKMKDLNAFDIKQATKIICGSARSMGIEVKE